MRKARITVHSQITLYNILKNNAFRYKKLVLILVGKQDTVQKCRVGSESRISGVNTVSAYREECKTIAVSTVMTMT